MEATKASLEAKLVKEREAHFNDLRLVAIHEGGLRDMAIALEAALREFAPNHKLVIPTGENAADGREREGGDDVYDVGAKAAAKRLDMAHDREDGIGVAVAVIERAQALVKKRCAYEAHRAAAEKA